MDGNLIIPTLVAVGEPRTLAAGTFPYRAAVIYFMARLDTRGLQFLSLYIVKFLGTRLKSIIDCFKVLMRLTPVVREA